MDVADWMDVILSVCRHPAIIAQDHTFAALGFNSVVKMGRSRNGLFSSSTGHRFVYN